MNARFLTLQVLAFCFVLFSACSTSRTVLVSDSPDEGEHSVPEALLSRSDTLRLGSWNIQHLGRKGTPRSEKDYQDLARIAAYFDFLAVQEVMNFEGITSLKDALEKRTKENWGMSVSHRVGRHSYREKYAFLWRESKIRSRLGGLVYLDSRDVFEREPFSEMFETLDGEFRFLAANVHLIHGGSGQRGMQRRIKEVEALKEYWNYLSKEAFPQEEVLFLFGDFNLNPTHPGWRDFLEVARPLMLDGGSTLSTIEGRYANLYDNIFIPKDLRIPIEWSGVFRFPELLGISHEEARRRISDHAPVGVVLRKDALRSKR
jgi:endonuclease/exonuclease/phosphatase family metal-dependent hydrolase